MSSSRYAAVASLLEDPLNLSCILREYRRRKLGDVKILPPPLKREGGGWVFPTLREAMRNSWDETTKVGARTQIDSMFEVYFDGQDWYVHSVEAESEIGPFSSEHTALTETRSLAAAEGYLVLDKQPWTAEDLTAWPL